MKVTFNGCDEQQKRFGNNTGNVEQLEVGKSYDVENVEVHSWHTKYYLCGIDGSFNSVCFDKEEDI